MIATTEQWWEPCRPTAQLWSERASTRFGSEAAPAVVSALKQSGTIITKGFSTGRMPLMDHNGILVYSWQVGSATRPWAVFARPGELLVDNPYDELIGDEMRPWQTAIRGVELEEFLRGSEEAAAAAKRSLEELDRAEASLTG